MCLRQHKSVQNLAKAFLEQLRYQLKQTLDMNCKLLGKQGAQGAFFKVSLCQYKYMLFGREQLRRLSQNSSTSPSCSVRWIDSKDQMSPYILAISHLRVCISLTSK